MADSGFTLPAEVVHSDEISTDERNTLIAFWHLAVSRTPATIPNLALSAQQAPVEVRHSLNRLEDRGIVERLDQPGAPAFRVVRLPRVTLQHRALLRAAAEREGIPAELRPRWNTTEEPRWTTR